MVVDEDFVEFIRLTFGSKEIGGKLGGALWCSYFREGFPCGNISVKKRTWKYDLCIHGS